jgi:hypothetical protein
MKYRTLKEATALIEYLVLCHLGDDWRVNINHRFKALYGRCDFLTHIIHIAPDCAIYCTEEHLRQMVLHEIAHGLTGNVGHNKIFKAVCGMIECANDTPFFSDYASLDYLEK